MATIPDDVSANDAVAAAILAYRIDTLEKQYAEMGIVQRELKEAITSLNTNMVLMNQSLQSLSAKQTDNTKENHWSKIWLVVATAFITSAVNWIIKGGLAAP